MLCVNITCVTWVVNFICCVPSNYARWCRSRQVPCNPCFLFEGYQDIAVWGWEILNQIRSYYKLTDDNREAPLPNSTSCRSSSFMRCPWLWPAVGYGPASAWNHFEQRIICPGTTNYPADPLHVLGAMTRWTSLIKGVVKATREHMKENDSWQRNVVCGRIIGQKVTHGIQEDCQKL